MTVAVLVPCFQIIIFVLWSHLIQNVVTATGKWKRDGRFVFFSFLFLLFFSLKEDPYRGFLDVGVTLHMLRNDNCISICIGFFLLLCSCKSAMQ